MNKEGKKIIITGVYRSGTEYFTAYLNKAKKINLKMYGTNFLRHLAHVRRTGEKDLAPFLMEHMASRHNLKINLPLICPSDYVGILKNHQKLLELVTDELLKNTILGEKIQLVWREIEELLLYDQSYFVIILVRDPRAIMASYKNFTYHEKPLYLSSTLNALDCMVTAASLKNQFPDNILIVKFEEFLLEKNRELAKIEALLNTKLTFDSELSDAGKAWFGNSNYSDMSPKRIISGWRTELNKNEIRFSDHFTSEIMADFGYSPNGKNLSLEELLANLNIGPKNEWLLKAIYSSTPNKAGIQAFPEEQGESDFKK